MSVRITEPAEETDRMITRNSKVVGRELSFVENKQRCVSMSTGYRMTGLHGWEMLNVSRRTRQDAKHRSS